MIQQTGRAGGYLASVAKHCKMADCHYKTMQRTINYLSVRVKQTF
jgi:hypothetical protein